MITNSYTSIMYSSTYNSRVTHKRPQFRLKQKIWRHEVNHVDEWSKLSKKYAIISHNRHNNCHTWQTTNKNFNMSLTYGLETRVYNLHTKFSVCCLTTYEMFA